MTPSADNREGMGHELMLLGRDKEMRPATVTTTDADGTVLGQDQCAPDDYVLVTGPRRYLDHIQKVRQRNRGPDDQARWRGGAGAMPVKDGPSCPGCGLSNYEGLCPHCRGDQQAYEDELVPPFETSRPNPQDTPR